MSDDDIKRLVKAIRKALGVKEDGLIIGASLPKPGKGRI